VFPGKTADGVSLQHLSLLLACPVIYMLPECPCSLCDIAAEGAAALTPAGGKRDAVTALTGLPQQMATLIA